jgi:hypothetical protein
MLSRASVLAVLLAAASMASAGDWIRPGLFGFASAVAQTRTNELPAPQSNWVSTRFREADTLVANPGQGWMNQQRRPKPEPRFPCSVAYVRFNWADAEPEQGKYNWQVIDDAIAAWKPRGAAVAFRVMTCNAHSAGYYASPKWLFDGFLAVRSFESHSVNLDFARGPDHDFDGSVHVHTITPP